MVSWKQLVTEALDPTVEAKGSTLVVQNHLSQMKMFTHRGGVEFFPSQDDPFQSRKKFIDAESRYNKIPLKIDRAIDILTGLGQVLIYFRPTQNGRYKIHMYEKDQFKAFYDEDGDINKVIIVYSYEVERGSIMNYVGGVGNTRWIRLTVDAQKIVREDFDTRPPFTNELVSFAAQTTKKKEYINSLKFIPCVVVKNYFGDDGRDGYSDFYPIRKQLENHDDLIRSLNSNLKFFGNSTFITSRSAREVLEQFGGDPKAIHNDSIASRSGFQNAYGQSSYGGFPNRSYSGGNDEMRVTRIIDNIASDDRAGYISPDPISPDHALHAREERESIHFALGGIDELGVRANATAYEMKTIYGKIATTAGKKARALFDYGLCIIFEMMIAAEEDLFRQSLALLQGVDQSVVTDEYIQNLILNDKLPTEGLFGLIPAGSRQVEWRYTGEVFEKSARDLMEESIVVRNLQELGMNGVDALKSTNLFENRTHAEIEEMLSKGYPYRYIQSVLGSTQFFAQVYGQLLQLPDFETGQPLGVSFPIKQLIERGMQTIGQELSYYDQYNPVNAGDPPEYKLGISQFNEYLNQQNEPISSTATTAINSESGIGIPNAYPSPSIYGWTPASNPYSNQYGWYDQSAISGSYGAIPEYAAQLPTPDTVVSTTRPAIRGESLPVFGPISAGYNPLYRPTIEPIPDNSANANRTTRRPRGTRSRKQ